jgi:hypothetical protein
MQRYDGQGTLAENLDKCNTQWRMTPLEEWPHNFIHTLELIPENGYVDHELCRGTAKWTILQQNFIVTFSFENENPNIDSTLKHIRGVIFVYEP